MIAKIIDGRELAKQTRIALKKRVNKLRDKYNMEPGLAVILVGKDPASAIYVRSKAKNCKKVGVYSEIITLPYDTSMETLLGEINGLNEDPRIDGILVQLPLPKHLDEFEVIKAIDPNKDVDGFHLLNTGALTIGMDCFESCTPKGIIKLIETTGIDFTGKKAVVVGRSNTVGKPIALMLLHRNATVTICHSRTKDLAAEVKQADILVAAVGVDRLIKGDMIKPGAIVIDVGMNRTDEGLFGDVDFESVSKVAGYITPVPGGVGPMTIAMLLQNTVESFEKKLGL